jgi:hypothetical protein
VLLSTGMLNQWTHSAGRFQYHGKSRKARPIDAFRSELRRDTQSYAATAAGDECASALKIEFHF